MPKVLFHIAIFIGFILFFLTVYFTFNESHKIKSIKPYIWLIFFGSIEEISYYYFFRDIPTAYWYRVFNLLDFMALYYYYKTTFDKKYNYLLYVFLTVFLLFYLFFTINFTLVIADMQESYLSMIITVFVFTLSILWFYEINKSNLKEPIWQLPNFYFIASTLLYYGATITLFISQGYIAKNLAFDDFWILWSFNIVFTIVLRVTFIIGIWKARTI